MSGETHTAIGRPVRKVDGVELVTGRAKFTADMKLPGMLYGYARRAGVPAGRIRAIDVSAALEVPGVSDVILAKDIPGPNIIGILPPFDQPILASEDIRYEGETIALVVARTRQAAKAGANAIAADIEPLEPVLDPEEALREGTRKIHPNGNVTFSRKLVKGNVEKGFEASEVIVENTYRTSFQEHAYIEPEAVFAVPGGDGRITVYASCQSPFHIRGHIAANLNQPASRVKVVQAYTGGSFGGKDDVATEMGSLAAVAAVRLNAPVMIAHERGESIVGSNLRHASKIRYRTGAKRDGTLVARDVHILLDGGAYASESPFVTMKTVIHAAGPYRVPHVRVKCTTAYTNKTYCGAFRGFGVPQVTFASESQMDELARALGMDPLDLRLKNALEAGEPTATGQIFRQSVGLVETIERVSERRERPRAGSSAMRTGPGAAAGDLGKTSAKREVPRNTAASEKTGTRGRRSVPTAAASDKMRAEGSTPAPVSDDRWLYGTGFACLLQGISNGAEGVDVVGASVQVSQDGSAVVGVGLSDMGQGARTVYAQIAAEVLGLSIDRVAVKQVDTDTMHDSGPTIASRSTTVGGMAVLKAAEEVKKSLRRMAGLMLKRGEERIVLGDNFAALESDKNARIPIAQVATAAYWSGFPLMSLSFSKQPDAKFDHDTHQGDIYIAYNFGTHMMRIRIDRLTGLVEVLEHLAAHDVGKAINPLGLEGQVEGGSLIGFGMAHMEKVESAGGRIANANFSDYAVPTVKDRIPTETIVVEDPNPTGPFGAKGAGEPPVAGAAAAFANAVADATGVRFTKLPITREDILAALGEPSGKPKGEAGEPRGTPKRKGGR